MSTIVSATRLWLNEAANPSSSRSFRLGSFETDTELAGDVRTYASGRNRMVRTGGTKTTYKALLRSPSLDDRTWLKARCGVPLIMRDPDNDGRTIAGYLSFPEVGTPSPVGVDITLTLLAITYSEAV